MTTTEQVRAAVRGAWAGELPERYEVNWQAPFHREVLPLLLPRTSVLDVGGGQSPSVSRAMLPPDCVYVGLDSSERELDLAPADAYDERIVADITVPIAALQNRFDIVVSWQVLEHVKPLSAALENIHSYLRPGGRFVAMLSGRASAFAVINRLLPHRIGGALVAAVMNRPGETVHRAYYDDCYYTALERRLSAWSDSEITSEYRGASYFGFSRLAQTAYIAYEETVYRRGARNLATHYRLTAVR